VTIFASTTGALVNPVNPILVELRRRFAHIPLEERFQMYTFELDRLHIYYRVGSTIAHRIHARAVLYRLVSFSRPVTIDFKSVSYYVWSPDEEASPPVLQESVSRCEDCYGLVLIDDQAEHIDWHKRLNERITGV